jgi:hypothetical protein
VFGPEKHELLQDRSPFSLRVAGDIKEAGEIVGVFGEVISGHTRYLGQIATLFVRLDNSDWRRDNRSAAGFKVGRSVARLNGKYPCYNPLGSDMEGFPYFVRFGSLNSHTTDEPMVNSALEAFEKSKAEPSPPPGGGPAMLLGNPGATEGPPSVS